MRRGEWIRLEIGQGRIRGVMAMMVPSLDLQDRRNYKVLVRTRNAVCFQHIDAIKGGNEVSDRIKNLLETFGQYLHQNSRLKEFFSLFGRTMTWQRRKLSAVTSSRLDDLLRHSHEVTSIERVR